MASKRKFNVLNHSLVPEHKVLTKKQADSVLKTLGFRRHQLPWLRASDPAVEAVGAKPGDVVRITRTSPTAGSTVVYRYVVPG